MKVVCQLLFCAVVVVSVESTLLSRKEGQNTINYYLYTKQNPSKPEQVITGDLGSIRRSSFNSNLPTRIIIHGWRRSHEMIPNTELRPAYLAVGDYNLISVDWSEHASPNYIFASSKVSEVGADVANFIDYLHQYAGMSFASLVVIGHSLGAHCAGFAGKFVKLGRLPYIVGLDPALPLFSYNRPNERLNSKDADYVETIQTNGGLQGFLEPIGKASFYPNWGRHQPGCGLDLDGSCAHARSVLYYADAIRGYKFTPVNRCSNYTNIIRKTGCDEPVPNVDIGDPTQIFKKNGIFYLSTNSEEPFGHK